MLEENKVIEYFLGILSQIKVFHWETMEYSKHKALDGLYTALNSLVDKFVETYMALLITKTHPSKPFNITIKAHSDISKIDKYLESERENIRKVQNQFKGYTEIQSTIDDILNAFNTCIYLCKMK